VHVSRTVPRPWGTYTVLEEGVGFKVKRVKVFDGARPSFSPPPSFSFRVDNAMRAREK